MPMRCVVKGCPNKFTKTKGVAYHTIPKDEERRKLWLLNCDEDVNLSSARICSKHFNECDYHRDLQAELLGTTPKNLLTSIAIPSFNLPNKEDRVATFNESSVRDSISSKKIVNSSHSQFDFQQSAVTNSSPSSCNDSLVPIEKSIASKTSINNDLIKNMSVCQVLKCTSISSNDSFEKSLHCDKCGYLKQELLNQKKENNDLKEISKNLVEINQKLTNENKQLKEKYQIFLEKHVKEKGELQRSYSNVRVQLIKKRKHIGLLVNDVTAGSVLNRSLKKDVERLSLHAQKTNQLTKRKELPYFEQVFDT